MDDRGDGGILTHEGPINQSRITNSFNDKVSAVVVGRGYTVELYELEDYEGDSLTVEGPAVIRQDDLEDHDLNDDITSYKLYYTEVTDEEPQVDEDGPDSVLSLYNNNSSDSWVIRKTAPISVATLVGGEYNDAISKLKIADGYSVTLYADPNYTDAPNTPCLLYTSPSPRDRTRSRMPSSA